MNRGGRPKTNWLCEYPEHVGDRVVENRYDQIRVTLDFMTRHGDNRLARVHQAAVCKKCADIWITKLRPQMDQTTLL